MIGRHGLGVALTLTTLGCMGPCGAPMDDAPVPDARSRAPVVPIPPDVGEVDEDEEGLEPPPLPEAPPPGDGWAVSTRSISGDRIVYQASNRTVAELASHAETVLENLDCATGIQQETVRDMETYGCVLADGRHALITVRPDGDGGVLWGVAAVASRGPAERR